VRIFDSGKYSLGGKLQKRMFKSDLKEVFMNKQIGLILLVAGVALLIWGISMTGSFSSEVSRAFTGSPTDKTVTVLIAGGICTALGAYQLSKKG
jgi:cytochrome c biogenesis factor